MYNIQNLLSMPVLSLYEGELVGQISRVFFDKKLSRVTHFMVTNEQDINYILYPKHIYKIGKNALTIKNNHCLNLALEDETVATIPAPLNVKCYTIQGEYVGKVTEISINEKFHTDTILLDGEKNLDLNRLASCSYNTIILYEENSAVKVSRFKFKLTPPRFFKNRSHIEVSTLPIEPIGNAGNSPKTIVSPKNNTKFLIGRIALQDIEIEDKKLLIKANSTITEKTISLAITHNKIKELMMFSKQK